jgi:hypothetical protein
VRRCDADHPGHGDGWSYSEHHRHSSFAEACGFKAWAAVKHKIRTNTGPGRRKTGTALGYTRFSFILD